MIEDTARTKKLKIISATILIAATYCFSCHSLQSSVVCMGVFLEQVAVQSAPLSQETMACSFHKHNRKAHIGHIHTGVSINGGIPKMDDL